MGNEYSELRDEIRKNYFDKFYHKTISLCKKYFKLIRRFHRKEFEDIRQDLFLVNFYIGKCHKKLYNIRNAIRYLKKCIRFALNDTCLNDARIALAECYEQICRVSRAVKNYNQSLVFYKIIGSNENRAKVLFNKAKLSNKPNSMLRIISIIEREENNVGTQNNGLLTELYVKLTIYYLNKQQTKELISLTSNVKNANIQKEILNVVHTNMIKQIA